MDSTAPISASPELILVIERNYESKALDYKSATAWNPSDRKSCCELVKDILAMANTDGGYIVIGVSEQDQGFTLIGVSLEEAGSYESTTLCSFVQRYADPPINLRVQKVQHAQKTFVVLEVPRFSDTPHICQKDFPGTLQDRTLYIRTDNNESAPLRSSADFRMLVEGAIRNRTDKLLSSFRAILTSSSEVGVGAIALRSDPFQEQVNAARESFQREYPHPPEKYSLFVQTVFHPDQFDNYRFTTTQLIQSARHATVDFTGWPFLFFAEAGRYPYRKTELGIEGVVSLKDFADNDIFDFWAINASGLFYKRELTSQSDTTHSFVLERGIVRHCAEAVFCMTRLYDKLLQETENVRVVFEYEGTRDRSLGSYNPQFRLMYGSNYVASRPSIQVSASFSLADWRAGIIDHSISLASEIIRHFGAKEIDAEDARLQIQKLFARQL